MYSRWPASLVYVPSSRGAPPLPFSRGGARWSLLRRRAALPYAPVGDRCPEGQHPLLPEGPSKSSCRSAAFEEVRAEAYIAIAIVILMNDSNSKSNRDMVRAEAYARRLSPGRSEAFEMKPARKRLGEGRQFFQVPWREGEEVV